jgi:SAM-dependent methyltransferase
MREELAMAVAVSSPSETSTRLWRNFPGVFGKLRPPLRPSPGDVANIERGMAGGGGRVLLLGVTPELSTLGNELIAIDNSPRMIEIVWPGDDHRRRAMVGDWTQLPFDDGAFDAVIGDGSINSAPEVMEQVIREARRVLRPGGRAVFRMFCSPEKPESLDAIREDVELGRSGNLHALKWRIAMSLAAATPNRIVAVQTILQRFDELFPDRTELAARTGWSLEEIATLDAYSGADHSMGFPTVSEIRDLAAPHLTHVSVMAGSGYPLAERCPTLVWSTD